MRNRSKLAILTLTAVVPAILLLAAGCATTAPRRAVERQAGTGDVAFRLVWDGFSDLDLIVQDPACDCIAFDAPHARSGGILDVDCNGSYEHTCEHPIENVFWPAQTAPPGDYRFWVSVHALATGGEPQPFELQLLRGKEVVWHREGKLEADGLAGPFLLHFPGGQVTAPLEGWSQRPPCGITAAIMTLPPGSDRLEPGGGPGHDQ